MIWFRYYDNIIVIIYRESARANLFWGSVCSKKIAFENFPDKLQYVDKNDEKLQTIINNQYLSFSNDDHSRRMLGAKRFDTNAIHLLFYHGDFPAFTYRPLDRKVRHYLPCKAMDRIFYN